MVTGGAGEPSAKCAKVDEAKEEEDPLVRRKEELILGVENARAEAKRWEKSLVRDAEEVAKRLKRKAATGREEPFNIRGNHAKGARSVGVSVQANESVFPGLP